MDPTRKRLSCLKELDLGPSASEDDIKRAYKVAALKYHPDKNMQNPDAADKFKQISAAYRYLTEGEVFVPNGMGDADLLLFMHIFARQFERPTFFYPNPFFGCYEDDDDDVYGYTENPFNNFTSYQRGAESYTSQFIRQNVNFQRANAQHGEYYQDLQKSAKKKKREAKRNEKKPAEAETTNKANFQQQRSSSAPRDQAERENSNSPNKHGPIGRPSTANVESSTRAKGESTTSKVDSGAPKVDSATANVPSKSKNDSNTNNVTEEQAPKKTKKQLLMEQKQREKEASIIREELEQKEREKREKIEKKRAAQLEKERKEREAKEAEEQKRLEEEARQEEERRKQRELAELQKRKERELAAKKKAEDDLRKKLMDDFDKSLLLDDMGDFKYTDPDLHNIIRVDNANPLGDAPKSNPLKLDNINGLNTQDLIKLQSASPRPEPPKQQNNDQTQTNRFGAIGAEFPKKNTDQFSSPRPTYQNREFYNKKYVNENQRFQPRANPQSFHNFPGQFTHPPPQAFDQQTSFRPPSQGPPRIPNANFLRHMPPRIPNIYFLRQVPPPNVGVHNLRYPNQGPNNDHFRPNQVFHSAVPRMMPAGMQTTNGRH